MRNLLFIACSVAAVLVPGAPAAAQSIDLAALKPTCPVPLKPNAANTKCEVDDTALAKLTDAAACSAAWLKFDDKATPKCTVVNGAIPAPSCGNSIPDLVAKDGKCFIEPRVPRSSISDYLGDCFLVRAVPQDKAFPFRGGEYLKVLSDKEAPGGKDKLLNVAKASGPIPVVNCKADEGAPVHQLAASELAAIGAHRYGWTYGVLVMPYKYYRGDRKLGDGVTIGPYIGWRMGEPGAGTTFAMSAGLSKVKGQVLDATDKTKVISTPDLAAISLAGGVMWDLNKSLGLKAFKVGVFVGTDRVSQDKVVTFPQHGKKWIALQIGFDFTDN